jgi:hypothetical protein
MRVYSLYLSTLTGQPTLAVFTGTINGSTLTVTSVSYGSLAVGQSFYTASGNLISITGFITGSGGSGNYSVSATATNATSTTYSSFSATQNVSKFAPTNKTNLAQVKWNINWREIFGNRNGECRVRTRFISSSSTAISWVANNGTLRATFSSNTSNSTNGFNLGFVRPQSDYTSGTNNTTYLDYDSTTSNGMTMIIPNSNGDFTISLFDRSETLMVNVPEYQVWLYFDVDDENPFLTDEKLPTIFNPR